MIMMDIQFEMDLLHLAEEVTTPQWGKDRNNKKLHLVHQKNIQYYFEISF